MHFSSFIVFNMPILFQPWLCGIQNVIRQTKYSAIPHDLLLSSVCVEKKEKQKLHTRTIGHVSFLSFATET